MQQINYKCPPQQQGKSAYISRNTVATMTLQLWAITNPGDGKVTLHHHLSPLASPQQERKGKNRKL